MVFMDCILHPLYIVVYNVSGHPSFTCWIQIALYQGIARRNGVCTWHVGERQWLAGNFFIWVIINEFVLLHGRTLYFLQSSKQYNWSINLELLLPTKCQCYVPPLPIPWQNGNYHCLRMQSLWEYHHTVKVSPSQLSIIQFMLQTSSTNPPWTMLIKTHIN